MTDINEAASGGTRKQRPAVGISLFARDGQAIWENGIHQNIAFLAMMLKRSDRVGPVYFLNGGDASALPTGLELDGLDIPLVKPADVTHELDVVIEMGAQLPVEWLRHMKALGKKRVACYVGHTYSSLAETPIFDKPSGHIFNGTSFDEVWVLEKSATIDVPLLRTLTRAPVYTIPHLWSPYFLDRRVAALAAEGETFGYRPGRRPWRLATLEPNISVVKSCHYPMLACDEFYRARPDAVQHMFVVNAVHMKEHPTFVHFANSLDLVRQHKATFEPRIELPGFMARHADAVVSHHWENAQNYLYYDVLHGGYPLIHNSTLLGDAGYYYPDFDSAAGGRALLDAWLHHDDRLDDYRAKAGRLLQSVSIDNPANLDALVSRLVA
ncbi:hypothetical protein BBJ41_26035 [Burkholderia stabilis]|uniref:DUF2827 domain-containing protein n=1 Tax=Burkholderia stabilis TaxID=95485 RepID=UPI000851A3AF|nr:DUF2827 domain-containing protein [Burkholderia stabilis]AOR70968.1 hypothetical protein BBJ41_26035 [Burkholderia stabilis]HDR9496282.1 DUF2827 domain-containing protein [Burkholderia stabilis]HDR9527880.1 DUF2827 domain-containing protein [Burkholderia stabilis]HDR9534923.1 DUF2827 domain-containing protein [Burkholderia stabilis]HDR9542840.1 DUF2827 domain-containing protein [Burkholderia stabilis]